MCLHLASTTQADRPKKLPDWFMSIYKSRGLISQYNLENFLRPAFLLGDFNGDKIQDAATLIVNKKNGKKGILIIHGRSQNYFIIAAGSKFGKIGFDDFDDIKWISNWSIFKDKVAYETKFDNGDIVGSIPRKMKNQGILIWENQDGAPLTGGIVYWNRNRYAWLHQGE